MSILSRKLTLKRTINVFAVLLICMATLARGILIIKDEKFYIIQPMELQPLLDAVGGVAFNLSRNLDFSKITAKEISYLPYDLYQHLSDDQLQQMMDSAGAINFFNTISNDIITLEALEHTHPLFFEALDLRGHDFRKISPDIFSLFDPWKTICAGELDEDQFVCLVHYFPDYENDPAELVSLSERSMKVLRDAILRSDKGREGLIVHFINQYRYLRDAKSLEALPNVTQRRLELIDDGFKLHMEPFLNQPDAVEASQEEQRTDEDQSEARTDEEHSRPDSRSE